jgi:hypothetical protein
MLELERQVSSIVITKATAEQFMELCVPAISVFFAMVMETIARISKHSGGHKFTRIRQPQASLDEDETIVFESKLPSYSSTDSDYGELVIQYGYMVLFGLCFPQSALINFLNNLVETRTDAVKIFALSQRADASDGGDIGAWLSILKFLSSLSVHINAGLLVFTGSTFDHILPDTLESKFLAYFVVERILSGGQMIIECTVREIPSRTHRFLKRQQYIVARSFNIGWKPYFRSNVEQAVDEDTAPSIHCAQSKKITPSKG